MALQKNIATKSGIILSYWRIAEISVNQDSKIATITVYPYSSIYSRQDGKQPVHSEDIRIKVEDFDYSDSDYEEMTNLDYTDHFAPAALNKYENIYVCAYNYLKGLPMFDGAIDI